MIVRAFLKQRKIGLCLLLVVTMLLCNTVRIDLDRKEQQRLREQAAMIPPYQPETVWCTDDGDIILLYMEDHPEAPELIFTKQGVMRDWELILLPAHGYFSFRKKDTQPVEEYLSGSFFMDDEATFRLTPTGINHPLFEGCTELIFRRYFIADDNCPHYHIRRD